MLCTFASPSKGGARLSTIGDDGAKDALEDRGILEDDFKSTMGRAAMRNDLPALVSGLPDYSPSAVEVSEKVKQSETSIDAMSYLISLLMTVARRVWSDLAARKHAT